MLASRRLFLLLTALVLCAVSTAAWAQIECVEFVGCYYNQVIGNTTLCAKVTPAQTGVLVSFEGITPHGIRMRAGPAYTDLFGKACVTVDWWPGVYTVKACAEDGIPDGGADGTGVCSKPAALVVFSDVPTWRGAAGGGELELFHYGAPPYVKKAMKPRDVTFAIYYGAYPASWFGALVYDNQNPLGPTSFVAKGLRTVNIAPFGPYRMANFTGYGTFKQGNKPPQCVYYHIYLDDYPPKWFTVIEIYDYIGNLLYTTAYPYSYSEWEIHNGDSIIKP